MSLEHLVVRPASKAQFHEAQLRNAAYWGVKAGVTVDDYMKLPAVFQEGVFARDGRLKYWVLVSKDEPESTNFYASCQVLTRDVLTLHPGQNSPRTSFGHSISFVIVPPEYRGKGYANRFMSLLHSVLAPHRYPNPNPTGAPITADHPSTVSVLYSAVGDYYSRCAPLNSVGESGWSRQASFITTWLLSEVKIPPAKGYLPPVELLSERDVTATLDSDDPNVPTDLLLLQRKDPSKTYFAFTPTAPMNAYSLTMSKLTPVGSSNASWGARIPGGSDFMIWIIFNEPELKLLITRMRATATSFPILLGAALRVAQDKQCESIEVWNVHEQLKEVAVVTGGVTTEREDHLSAFKWYGQQPETARADVVWALDERWC